MHAQITYQLFAKLLIGPDFTSLADEIAEPRPDMNIKVTAFTVSKKLYYTTFTREEPLDVSSHMIPGRQLK